jgi:hypothetical protein
MNQCILKLEGLYKKKTAMLLNKNLSLPGPFTGSHTERAAPHGPRPLRHR